MLETVETGGDSYLVKLSLVVTTPEVESAISVALLSGSFDDKIAKAVELEVDGLELMTTDPAKLDVKNLHSKLKAVGLEISAIASGALAGVTGLTLLQSNATVSSLASTRLLDLITFAADIGAPLVTIGSFRGRVFSDPQNGRETLRRLLYDAAVRADSKGVRLVLEPLNRYETDLLHSAEETLAFIHEVNHPGLGLLLDTYHVNIEESSWTNPFREALACGKLWHVHVGDNNRLPPGKGLIDFSEIIKTLKMGGYSGYISAELLAQPDPDTAAIDTINYIRPLTN